MTDPPEIAVAQPADAVLAAFDAAMRRRARRSLGMRLEREYVGVVEGDAFEMWERRQQAIHLVGRVVPSRTGCVVSLETHVTPRTWRWIAIFFVLFAVLVGGVLSLPGRSDGAPALAVVAACALVLVFYVAARLQRTQLVAHARGVLAELEAHVGVR